MNEEHRKLVKDLFHAAVELPASDRQSYLAQATHGNTELLREVAWLISAHEKQGSFIESPGYADAPESIIDQKPQFKPGQVLGSYEISSFISRGGMGEIYLAHDKRLGRKVALKLLPDALTKDASRLRRFEQEARAASALNHPNIITIYEISEVNSTLMIAAEFVEGETLRQHLTYGPLHLNDALHVAIQIADALSAAHKAGIVHRDVKPENLMIRPDGYVKVLDFGLAKLVEPRSITSFSDMPTRKVVRTGSGTILGTVGYMSPEQARGQTVDERSDIFNLGAVIYEMVSGKMPFVGETSSDVFAAILKNDPEPLSHVMPEVPSELVRIVTKALRKDREERYQVVKDLLLDLKSLKEDLDFQAKLDRSVAPSRNAETPDETNPVPISTDQKPLSETSEIKTAVSTITHTLSAEIKRHKKSVVFAGATIAVLLTAGVVWLYRFVLNRTDATTPQLLRTSQITFSPGLDGFPSLSPDGKSVAYSSDQNGSFEIYVKQVTSGGGELQLTSDGKQNMHPSWSPDGQRIAYYSRVRGGIWVVSALGGAPKQMTDFGARPVWSPDGSMIAFQSGTPGETFNSRAMAPSTLWIVQAEGGNPRQITRPGIPAGGHSGPSWSADGKRIAFEQSDYISSSCWSVNVATGEVKRLTAGVNPIYALDGRHIFFIEERSSGALVRLPLSSTGEPAGEAVIVLQGSAGVSFRNLAISSDGTKLAYSATRTSSNLWTIPLSPETNNAVGVPAVFSRDTSLRNNLVRFSPDGRKLALNRWRPGTSADIWIADANGSNLTQVTNNPATDTEASWFPDGNKLAFLSDRENNHLIFWTISLGTGKEERFLDLGDGVQFAQMSPDGKQIAFNLIQNGALNVWVADVSDGQKRQLTFDGQLMGFPCWSLDSRLIAFEQQHGENAYLMIMPREGGQPTQLTFDQGKSWPHSWSRDSDKIAFAGERNGIWNVYWVSRSTREQRQLTNYSKLNAFVRYPAWSPLGNQIVYEYAETTGNIWLLEFK